MKRRITIVLVAGAAALGVASCGGDDDEDTTAAEETTETTTAATGATGAAGDDEAAVAELLAQGLVGQQGLTEEQAQCVADLIAPELSDEEVTDVQDPAYVEEILSGIDSEIQECANE